MISRLLSAGPRGRALAALAAVLIVSALGLLGAGALLASPGATGRASAKREALGRERFDIVGEDHPTGGLQATFGGDGFPGRAVVVTVPGSGSLQAARFHVIEDGSPVQGVIVTQVAHTPSSRYALRYLSHVRNGENEVELSVVVDGVGVIDEDYRSPAARSGAAAGKPKSFWTSGIGLLGVSFAAALLIALALMSLVVPRRRRTGLRRRVGEFTAQVPAPVPVELPGAPPATRFAWLTGLLARMSWWPRFEENVRNAGFARPATELVGITTLVTVPAAMLIGVAVGAAGISILIMPLGAVLLNSLVGHKLRKRRQQFGDQLAAHLEELASAMRAGHGLVSGLTAVAQSASEPSHTEWNRVLADEQLGMPLEEAMRALAKRMDCDDVEQVALVASLHHRTGGNMAEVLDRVSEGVRERAELRRELRALTSQARLSRWVVTALPIVLVGVIDVLDPVYMRPLFHTTGGLVIVGISIVMLTVGSLVMQKLTEIKV
jgi:tight adherence protein B